MSLLFPGTSHPALAESIAKRYTFALGKCEIKKFSCQEIYVRLLENVRGKSCYILQTITEKVSDDFMEVFLLADALRRHDARDVTLIIPHFGYARQDRRAVMGETISARVMADLLVKAGVQRVITFDLHSDQIEGFFSVPVDNLHCYELFAEYFKKKRLGDLVVVAPDAGAAKIARRLGILLKAPIAILHKQRPAHHLVEHTHIVGEVKGKTAILFDDMIDTAGTTCASYEVLIKHGASQVYAAVTHGILSGSAYEKLSSVNFKEIVITDTIPLKQKLPNIKVLSVVELLRKVL
jgi:ribose-phosphate pyrophosphokinase